MLTKPAPGVGCAINITTGHETRYRITQTNKSKKVLVVGGGPAGMEAARVAALRGHHVALWERESDLGGQLNSASVAPHKDRLGTLLHYYKNELKKLGVEIKRGIEVTPAKIEQFAPDTVVIATGAKPSMPRIADLDKAHPVQAIDVLTGKVKVGENVAIIGGELVASEVAEFLASKGKKVTMLRRGKEMAQKVNPVLRDSLLGRLKKAGVNMLTGVTYEKATDKSLAITTKDGKRKIIKTDTIVLAAGAVSEKSLYDEVKNNYSEIYLIGDSVSPRNLRDAINEGFEVGAKI